MEQDLKAFHKGLAERVRKICTEISEGAHRLEKHPDTPEERKTTARILRDQVTALTDVAKQLEHRLLGSEGGFGLQVKPPRS